MANTHWKIKIDINLKGNEWAISLTASEQSVLTMLRAGYSVFESQLKQIADEKASQRPMGLIDDALVLLRCLVFNRLQEHNGKFVIIQRA